MKDHSSFALHWLNQGRQTAYLSVLPWDALDETKGTDCAEKYVLAFQEILVMAVGYEHTVHVEDAKHDPDALEIKQACEALLTHFMQSPYEAATVHKAVTAWIDSRSWFERNILFSIYYDLIKQLKELQARYPLVTIYEAQYQTQRQSAITYQKAMKQASEEKQQYQHALPLDQVELVQHYEAKLATKEAECEALKLQYNEKVNEYVTLQAEHQQFIARVKESTQKAVETVNSLNERIAQKEQELRDLRKDCVRMQNELNNLRDMNETLERSNTEIKAQNTQILADNAEIKKRNEEIIVMLNKQKQKKERKQKQQQQEQQQKKEQEQQEKNQPFYNWFSSNNKKPTDPQPIPVKKPETPSDACGSQSGVNLNSYNTSSPQHSVN